MFAFQKKLNNVKMDIWKLLVFLIVFNNPIQGKEFGVSIEFLEAFTAAHDRHSTVVIAEKNSGTEKIIFVFKGIFLELFLPHPITIQNIRFDR